jgi:hypothetical protein
MDDDLPLDDGDDFDAIDDNLDLDDQDNADLDGAEHQPGAQGEQEEQPRNRGSARIQRLAGERDTYAREAAAARDAANAAQRELEALRNGQQRQSSEAQEQQRLAQMEPWERAEYIARQTEQRTLGVVARLERSIADQGDKAAFASMCATKPAVAKVSAEVEKLYAEQIRNGGTPPPREVIAAYIIGQQVLNGASKARTSQARTAAANVSRERAAPTTTGSDVRGQGGKTSSVRDRLRDVNI